MTGRWDYTLVGQSTKTGILDLTEDDGLLSGTMYLDEFQIQLTGSVTNTYQVTLAHSNESWRIEINGTTTQAKNTFNGKMDFYDRTQDGYEYVGFMTMTATKRK